MSISGGLESSMCLFPNVMPEELSGVACMCVLSISEADLYVQLTLAQHGYTYMHIFFNKYIL